MLYLDGRLMLSSWENFVFATLVSANFAYATLEFDISLLPLLAFDNTSQMPFHGKNDIFFISLLPLLAFDMYHNCHSKFFSFATEWQK